MKAPSQSIEDRTETTERAVEELVAAIEAESTENAPLELRVVRAPGDPEDGTRLLAALSAATEDIPRERFAGAILVTDGAVVDADQGAPLVAMEPDGAPTAPVHTLVTGRPDEYDRRIQVEAAPSFGIVDEKVKIRFRVVDDGVAPPNAGQPRVEVFVDGERSTSGFSPVGRLTDLDVPITHGGATVVEIRLAPVEGELTTRNNAAAFSINGVRDRLKVLLVSGEPHPGERTWRNLLKSDPSVELVHFTILKPPEKDERARRDELALIEFPTHELFEEKLDSFDLIVFDRFRNRPRVLRWRYIENIADFVRKRGKAVLISTGPAFAGSESMSVTPLGEILPATPTGRIVEGAYRPELTEIGAKHPVTRGLEGRGSADKPATWGRWFRRLEVDRMSGDLLMEAEGGGPLILLDRVGEGRVAMIASDHTWLWARGYDGGGPQAELLRRVSHWLMKEPELEEEALTAEPVSGGFEITRRSLIDGDKTVLATAPDGVQTLVTLEQFDEGVWRARVETETLGVHRLMDAPGSVIAEEGESAEPLTAVAVVGPPSPREFAKPVSTLEPLTPISAVTGGAALRLSEDGVPDLRRTRSGRAASGDGWIGLARREAYEVRGVSLAGLAPSWLLFGLAALFAIAAWRVEGR